MVSQREHVDALATRLGQPVATVAAIIRAHNGLLSETIAAGESVVFSGFGTFRREEKASGPVAAFTPGAALRRKVAATTEDDAPTGNGNGDGK